MFSKYNICTKLFVKIPQSGQTQLDGTQPHTQQTQLDGTQPHTQQTQLDGTQPHTQQTHVQTDMMLNGCLSF